MPTDVVTTIVTAAGAAALALFTYVLTKDREREAELRKEKLSYYKDLVASLSGIISGEDTPAGQQLFSTACNNLNLVAPQSVIQALQAFQDETRSSNPNQSLERHDQLLSKLLYEIRKDLSIWPKDSQDFKVRLWASGVRTNGP